MKTNLTFLWLVVSLAFAGPVFGQVGGSGSGKPTKAPSPTKAGVVSYQVGEVFYVHARSGLTLRRSGSAIGEKISTLPYGEAVTVVGLPNKNARYVAEKYGPHEVAGYWPKIRSSAGVEGYVFDGYLSRSPILREDPEEGMDYGDAFYGMVSKRSGGKRSIEGEEPGLMKDYSYVQSFANGAAYTSKYYEGGATYVITTPKGAHSMGELLVMLRSFYYQEPVNTMYNPENNSVLVTPEQEGQSFLEIQQTESGGLKAEFSVAD